MDSIRVPRLGNRMVPSFPICDASEHVMRVRSEFEIADQSKMVRVWGGGVMYQQITKGNLESGFRIKLLSPQGAPLRLPNRLFKEKSKTERNRPKVSTNYNKEVGAWIASKTIFRVRGSLRSGSQGCYQRIANVTVKTYRFEFSVKDDWMTLQKPQNFEHFSTRNITASSVGLTARASSI